MTADRGNNREKALLEQYFGDKQNIASAYLVWAL